MFRIGNRRAKLTYWIVTPLFLVLQGWSAMQYVSEAPRMVQTITNLGYPLYFMKVLALAKFLGILAIATGFSTTLKEWAYAGFTFDVLGAFASHLGADDSPFIALVPLGFLVVQLASYFSWRELRRSQVRRRRRAMVDFPPRSAVESHA
jgi:uncharacterized membrane protein YphA (DoxX/SURF4 family)